MKPNTGQASIYHTRLPQQWSLERMSADILSRDALRRLKWLDHYRRHGNARKTCRYFGISPTTFYKWRTRFQAYGFAGLEERSRAPVNRRVSSVPREHVSLIVGIRGEHPAWSKHKIAVVLARDHGVSLSASTVGRILSRKGLYCEKKSLKRRRAARRREKKKRAERWMRDMFPGALVQVDTKHLNFLNQRYYQFTAVDTFSRVGFIHVSTGISSRAGEEFLALLTENMPFAITAVQTDNGSEFAGGFDRALEEAGIEHYYSHPYCPKHNARVERMILSTEEELWAFKAAYTVRELNELADEWIHTYNYERPHQTLGYKTPVEYLKSWSEMSKDRERVSTM